MFSRIPILLMSAAAMVFVTVVEPRASAQPDTEVTKRLDNALVAYRETVERVGKLQEAYDHVKKTTDDAKQGRHASDQVFDDAEKARKDAEAQLQEAICKRDSAKGELDNSKKELDGAVDANRKVYQEALDLADQAAKLPQLWTNLQDAYQGYETSKQRLSGAEKSATAAHQDTMRQEQLKRSAETRKDAVDTAVATDALSAAQAREVAANQTKKEAQKKLSEDLDVLKTAQKALSDLAHDLAERARKIKEKAKPKPVKPAQTSRAKPIATVRRASIRLDDELVLPDALNPTVGPPSVPLPLPNPTRTATRTVAIHARELPLDAPRAGWKRFEQRSVINVLPRPGDPDLALEKESRAEPKSPP